MKIKSADAGRHSPVYFSFEFSVTSGMIRNTFKMFAPAVTMFSSVLLKNLQVIEYSTAVAG